MATFTGKQTQIYAKLNPVVADVPAAPSYANLIAQDALAEPATEADAHNLLANGFTITPVGTSSGAPTTESLFQQQPGEADAITTPGEASTNDITITVLADWANATHKAIRDAADGTPIAIALLSRVGAQGTVVLIQGTKSSDTQAHATGARTQLSFVVTPSRKPRTFDK